MKKTALHLVLLPNIFTALFALNAPLTVNALGLGQMKVQSALGQPFLAEITLVDAPDSAGTSLKVSLASPQTYEHLGIPVADVLNRLVFEVKRNKQGKFVIHIHSRERMSEPYMQIVVDVTWLKGQLYKAYTVLLDPPGYKLDRNSLSNNLVSRKRVVRQFVIPEDHVTSHRSTENKNIYGPTLTNENVWQIAQRYKTPDLILPQVVLAIVGKNPDAFNEGNLNGLKSGERLEVPSNAEIINVPSDLATVEVMAHDKAWDEKKPIDHILTPPYINGKASTANPIAEFSKVPSIPKLTQNPVPLLQLVPQNILASVSAPKVATTEQDAILKAELSITTAAIETLRESNAILTEQMRFVQKENKKLEIQLIQRDKEIKLIRNQIQNLEKERQILIAQTNKHSGNKISFSLWSFLILLTLAGGAFWYFKRRKPIETETSEANMFLIKPVIHPVNKAEAVSESEVASGSEVVEVTPYASEVSKSPDFEDYVKEEFIEEETSSESPQDNLMEFEPGLHQFIAEERTAQDVPEEDAKESNSLNFTSISRGESGENSITETLEDDNTKALDTLLDLAKTYVGMGDNESAFNSLNEVIAQGNKVQKEKAQNMIDELTKK